MKFGVFFLLEQPEWTTQARVYADVLAQAAYAEALGYDSVWLASTTSRSTASVVDGRLMGALRPSVRGGSASAPPSPSCVQPPAPHCEEWAMVDQLSEGRLDFGVGAATSPASSAASTSRWTRAASGSRRRSRYQAAWTQDRVNFEGAHLPRARGRVLPARADPAPPIRIACLSPDTFEARRAPRREVPLGALDHAGRLHEEPPTRPTHGSGVRPGIPPTSSRSRPSIHPRGADATATRRDTERSILWYFATLARVIAASRDPAQVRPPTASTPAPKPTSRP